MTPGEREKRAEAPEQEEPKLGDGTRHTNGQYTLARREGVLPEDVVEIGRASCRERVYLAV